MRQIFLEIDSKGVIIDLTPLQKEEIIDLVDDLPISRLERWLQYYIEQEAYEVCCALKTVIEAKTNK